MTEISTTYKAIFYNTFNNSEDIEDKAYDLVMTKYNNISLEGFEGCPACEPYLSIEGNTFEEVENFVKELVEFKEGLNVKS